MGVLWIAGRSVDDRQLAASGAYSHCRLAIRAMSTATASTTSLLATQPTPTARSYEGLLAVYYGSPTGLGATPGWTMEGNEPDRYLGETGSRRRRCQQRWMRRHRRFRGASTTILNTHEIYLGSLQVRQPAHWTSLVPYEGGVSTAGDVNCDGFDDVIVGEPDSIYSYERGAALVYLGSSSGVSSEPAWVVQSDRTAAQFGRSAVAAGDVNGDGCGDVAVGAPSYNYGTAGYLFTYLGSPRGLSMIPQWTAYRLAGGDGFGSMASTAGDVNGDGNDDLLGAHPKESYFNGEVVGYYGSAAGLRETIFFANRTSQPPAIDGDFGDWEPTARFALDRTSAETSHGELPAPADSAASVRAKWDLLNLYLAVHVSDDVIVNDSSDFWRDDEIELAFYAVYDGNPAGGDTHQYTINADGRLTDFGQPNPPIEAVAVPVAGGWNVEVKHSGDAPVRPVYPSVRRRTPGLRRRPARRRRRRGLGQLSDLAGQQHGHQRRGFRHDAPGRPRRSLAAYAHPDRDPTLHGHAHTNHDPHADHLANPHPHLNSYPNPRTLARSQHILQDRLATHGGYEHPIDYTLFLSNTGGRDGQITLIDVPPLPYVPGTAWGGLWWDPATQSLRWQGTVRAGFINVFGYRLAGPSACVPPGTVYTNTLTIDDGYHPPFVRSAQVVVEPGPTPAATCTPVATPTHTATATETTTVTATTAPSTTATSTPTPIDQIATCR